MKWMFFVCSLKAMRAKVWKARLSSPLFNCKIYARNMEVLYRKMWQKYVNGEEASHIADIGSKHRNTS